MFADERRKQADRELRVVARSAFSRHGKCDFCGETNARVKKDLETVIPAGNTSRAALVCESCADAYALPEPHAEGFLKSRPLPS